MLDALTALDLARIQFAFTVSFHIIFPAFTIGLASYLLVLESLWFWTRDDAYATLFAYWKKIFAVAFGMGVVSGIVMSYQFGTNWSSFADKAGPIVGPLMGYEVLSAFFLEAGFLGIMLFGFNRVGPKLHLFATAMVAVGTLSSAFWILSVNSWMQTPAGFAINDAGQFVPENWWAIIFNPSFPYRLVHMVLAAYLTTAFVVGGVGAWHLLKNSRDRGARIMFSMAMWMAIVVTPLQIVAGDLHGLNTLKHQPAKIAAMEGHFKTHENGAPLYLFGIPDDQADKLRWSVGIPNLGSYILTHDWDGKVKGLEAFPEDKQPPVAWVFWSFRIMVALGLAMLAVGGWALVQRLRRRLYADTWLQRAAVAMGPSGFVAVLAGWVTTEVGRQPYTVYGLMTTAESASTVGAPAVAASLVAFIIVYFTLFGAGTVYILRLMAKPPRTGDVTGGPETDGGPTRAAGLTPAPSVAPDKVFPAE
ncbi:cytochrome ubiquinol oxidase subunit I [Rhodovibrio sodomensis]|uniref:Cytochrome ubiquinol oxidase subunit I n=1 Tax=Rhodovibrio sodomensis TaxID=1088 RepID=A0ABS1DHH2_9PROT|nr:cytochrome ubiquinol oxidase subunit I [Rhodovibrio sodomensis]MBK1668973.1 cytochrome ubiquinol oxidase subunit I [Rhodovibrio sodomensis]